MVNKKIWFIGLAIILILFVGGFVWFRYGNKKINNIVDSNIFVEPSVEVVQQEREKIQDNFQDSQKILDEKQKTDFDLDGLSDSEEKQFGTDLKNMDTDGDGLTDYDETKKYQTNPTKADTDGDGFSDSAELRRGYNPLGPGKLK